MNVLLLGAGGQLGRELRRSLGVLGTLTAFDRAGFDLAEPGKFRHLLSKIRPDVIVNAAAYTAVDLAESETDIAHAVNALAPGILAEEARRLGALLLHFSTDYVFDGEKTRPYVESDATNPLCVYGKTKLAGEQAIQASGCRHLILRISWVYGPHGSNFFKTISRIARTRPDIRVVNDQWGTPITTLRLATLVPALLNKLAAPDSRYSGATGLYHLTPAGCTTWYEYALQIVARLGIECEVLPMTSASLERPARRPMNSLMDSSRFHKDFDLSVGHWIEGFEEICRSLPFPPE